jgi:outer membrane protein assembly factor BamE (lipoprotein component of BamABCDE complex)
MNTSKIIIFLSFMLLFNASCQTTPKENKNSPYTHGNVQLTLKKGITTQAEVLESFGSPNITTIDADGNEVWTYQKHATVSKSQESSAYGTVILFGGGEGSSGFEQSSRTMTLIIKFDDSKKVVDFKSMSTSF